MNTKKTLQYSSSEDIAALLLRFTSDSKWLLLPSRDFTIFWNIDTGKISNYNNIHSDRRSEDDRWFAYRGNENDKVIKLVDINSGEIFEYYNYNLSKILSFVNESKQLMFLVNNNAKFWDISSGKIVDSEIKIHPKSRETLTKDHKLIAMIADDKNIEVWNLNTRKLVSKFIENSNNILELEFSSNGKLLASLSKDGTVKIWRVD